MKNEIDKNLQAATQLSGPIKRLLSRGFLHNIDAQRFISITDSSDAPYGIRWVQISELGQSRNRSVQQSLAAMQTILQSVFVPKEMKLLFLVNGNKTETNIYFGIWYADMTEPGDIKNFVGNFTDFSCSSIPGLKLNPIEEGSHEEITINKIFANQDANIVSLTGIPSIKKNAESINLDSFIQTMKGKEYTLLVEAAPMDRSVIEGAISRLDEIKTKLETVKSFSVSKQEGISGGQTITTGTQDSKGEAGKDPLSALLTLGGAGLAAAVGIPPEMVLIGGAMLTPTSTHTVTTVDTTAIQEGWNKSQSVTRSYVNSAIEFLLKDFDNYRRRLEVSLALGAWKTSTYIISADYSCADRGGLFLKSLLSGSESASEPIEIEDLRPISKHIMSNLQSHTSFYMNVEVNGQLIDHPLGKEFAALSSILNTEELSLLVNVPTQPYRGVNVVDEMPAFSLKEKNGTIRLGKLWSQGIRYQDSNLCIDLEQLSSHTLISGINGSGKTTTIKHILNSLLDCDKPFMVVEPSKFDYVTWAIRYNRTHEKKIKIWMPGLKKWHGEEMADFHLNPFEIMYYKEGDEYEVKLKKHIQMLESVLLAAMPMQEVLPTLVKKLIYDTYRTNVGTKDEPRFWLPIENKELDKTEYKEKLEATRPLPDSRRPTLRDACEWIPRMIRKTKYEDKVKGNLEEALYMRISSFLDGFYTDILCHDEPSETLWKELFEGPVIVNIDHLGDEEKAFFMGMLLMFLTEYRKDTYDPFSPAEFKHLMVIEEAHRIMNNPIYHQPGSSAVETAKTFSNILSEVRGYGQGLMIAEQIPSRLIVDAIRNTNLKITHRLGSEEDRIAIGKSMTLTEEQINYIGNLAPGIAIVRGSLNNGTYLIEIPNLEKET